MQITVTVKLKTSSEMAAALVQTMRRCNAACDRISRVAFESRVFRKYDLHSQSYHSIKAETELAAGHVVCAIAKVANAYKLDTHTRRTFQPLGAIELNKDTLTWKVEEQTVTLSTVNGRVKLSFLCSSAHKKLLRGKRGLADLLLRDGQFYLCVAVTLAEGERFTPEGVIGVDLGIVNVATDKVLLPAGQSMRAHRTRESDQPGRLLLLSLLFPGACGCQFRESSGSKGHPVNWPKVLPEGESRQGRTSCPPLGDSR